MSDNEGILARHNRRMAEDPRYRARALTADAGRPPAGSAAVFERDGDLVNDSGDPVTLPAGAEVPPPNGLRLLRRVSIGPVAADVDFSYDGDGDVLIVVAGADIWLADEPGQTAVVSGAPTFPDGQATTINGTFDLVISGITEPGHAAVVYLYVGDAKFPANIELGGGDISGVGDINAAGSITAAGFSAGDTGFNASGGPLRGKALHLNEDANPGDVDQRSLFIAGGQLMFRGDSGDLFTVDLTPAT